MAVRVAPGMTCARKPSDSTTRTALSISPLPAWAVITMSMAWKRLLTGNNTLRSNLTHAFCFCLDQNGRKRSLDLGAMLLVLRRQLQAFTEVFGRFINRETRAFGRDFEQDSAWLTEIDRMK